ncbi:hypothetical protein [Streptomyces sp. NPDC127084]|uniref:hypothetical protein n=1 Tax=Streptomyces sp. NPDC127084 TaxID=3347133 RepID=UPI003651D34A
MIWVAPSAPSSDRPKVNGAATWAAKISIASAINWAITAHFANSTRYAQDSITLAMM